MLQYLRASWREQKQWYAAGFLVSTFLFLLFFGVNLHHARRSIAEQKATALGATAGPFLSEFFPLQSSQLRVRNSQVQGLMSPSVVLAAEASAGRQIVKQAALVGVASSPHSVAGSIGALADRLGGHAVSLTRTEDDQQRQTAEVVFRIPASRFDEARAEIRKLAGRVEQEKVESEDITSSYADRISRLNSRLAVERQYLEVLKRAGSVKEILEVHEKLGEIREEIEAMESELQRMAHQVAMSSISVTLHSEAAPLVLGIRWSPRDAFKRAINNTLQALTGYVEIMAEFALLIPVIVLWTVTILFLGAHGWRLLRWMWRFFVARHAAPVVNA